MDTKWHCETNKHKCFQVALELSKIPFKNALKICIEIDTHWMVPSSEHVGRKSPTISRWNGMKQGWIDTMEASSKVKGCKWMFLQTQFERSFP
jgi:hypothetical protein